jgi:hypothetical protein
MDRLRDTLDDLLQADVIAQVCAISIFLSTGSRTVLAPEPFEKYWVGTVIG